MKELHRIVNEAIRAAAPGDDRVESKFYDLSHIDLEKLRDEFAKRSNGRPPRCKISVRWWKTSSRECWPRIRCAWTNSLSAEQRRAAEEGLSEEELALFDLITRPGLRKADRERVKLESRNLLTRLREVIETVDRWTEKEQTQAEVKSLILDHVFATLPDPPFSAAEKEAAADRLYQHVWQLSASGGFAAVGA
jgi:type I restriction enzyme, R subunit